MRTKGGITLIAAMSALLMMALAGRAFAGHRIEHQPPGALISANSKGVKASKAVKRAKSKKLSVSRRAGKTLGGRGVRSAAGTSFSTRTAKAGSRSIPDQNGKGPERDVNGTDRPGGPGGLDVTDQDSNNGCGNDRDFEDDSEGLCRGQRGATSEPDPSGGLGGFGNEGEDGDGDGPLAPMGGGASTGVRVLGGFMPSGVLGAASGVMSALAFTGARADMILALGLALLLAGALIRRRAAG